jgi:hypothetical protein
MSTTRAVTLRLDTADYERLQAAAERRGIAPSALARDYVRASLAIAHGDGERRRQVGLAALDRLAQLTADLPPSDALRIARESREELEARPHL